MIEGSDVRARFVDDSLPECLADFEAAAASAAAAAVAASVQ